MFYVYVSIIYYYYLSLIEEYKCFNTFFCFNFAGWVRTHFGIDGEKQNFSQVGRIVQNCCDCAQGGQGIDQEGIYPTLPAFMCSGTYVRNIEVEL